jgi:hypothetical protein
VLNVGTGDVNSTFTDPDGALLWIAGGLALCRIRRRA